jgi:hypothetical protein
MNECGDKRQFPHGVSALRSRDYIFSGSMQSGGATVREKNHCVFRFLKHFQRSRVCARMSGPIPFMNGKSLRKRAVNYFGCYFTFISSITGLVKLMI